jgi:hypothetical protein
MNAEMDSRVRGNDDGGKWIRACAGMTMVANEFPHARE